jgi:hypothetical protein
LGRDAAPSRCSHCRQRLTAISKGRYKSPHSNSNPKPYEIPELLVFFDADVRASVRRGAVANFGLGTPIGDS